VRKLFLIGLALLAVAFVGVPAFAQTNPNPHHNGVEYFFFNPIVPPTNATTVTRSFGSASSIGNESFGAAHEGNSHPMGVQQDGFEAWNGQAGPGAGAGSFPLGFSLMSFRRGGTFSQGTGTVVAAASWLTSLPCSAPWFWIVTFGWGTAFTHTASSGPASQNFHMSIRGETNQTIGNQNYFTGSGNERNLETGGLSFLEDTLLGTAFQLVGAQEWSQSYYTVDGTSTYGRDPSGTAGFGLDFGTGGRTLRAGSTTINPGAPADTSSIRVQANQNLGLTTNLTTLNLITSPQTGGGLTTDGTGSFTLPAGDGRTTNLVADGILTGLGFSLSIVLKTGGTLSGLTGNIATSGVAQTIPLPLGSVAVPPALVPLQVRTQFVSITFDAPAGFGPMSTADNTRVN
jgi:hypothetical protein